MFDACYMQLHTETMLYIMAGFRCITKLWFLNWLVWTFVHSFINHRVLIYCLHLLIIVIPDSPGLGVMNNSGLMLGNSAPRLVFKGKGKMKKQCTFMILIINHAAVVFH